MSKVEYAQARIVVFSSYVRYVFLFSAVGDGLGRGCVMEQIKIYQA